MFSHDGTNQQKSSSRGGGTCARNCFSSKVNLYIENILINDSVEKNEPSRV